MDAYKTEGGFTVVEIIITIVVISIFLTIFIQLFIGVESQRSSVVTYASLNDLAQTNLRKITNKTQIGSDALCDASPSSNTNNLTIDANAVGSNLFSSSAIPESPLPSSLPSSVTQALKVVYPQGCNTILPAEIISTVNYKAESVVRASYIN